MISEIFATKNEQQSDVIGQVECTSDNLANMFVGLLSSMGMSNPSGLATRAVKGVTITKKGKKYTLTLAMFKPPIIITWHTPIDYKKLVDVINQLASSKKKVGYINIQSMANGQKLFQLATV